MFEEYKIFDLIKFRDHRGYFYESFSRLLNKELKKDFVQDNISFSQRGTIRGLHYQWDRPMGKLIHVIKGSIIDHIVDIRKGSKNSGRAFNFHLNSENNKVLWIPAGYAHGFEALEDSIVMYKCTNFYNNLGEGCINFFDKNINLSLTIDEKDIIISEKDKKGITWEEYESNPKF